MQLLCSHYFLLFFRKRFILFALTGATNVRIRAIFMLRQAQVSFSIASISEAKRHFT
jgi:hypothetical protein